MVIFPNKDGTYTLQCPNGKKFVRETYFECASLLNKIIENDCSVWIEQENEKEKEKWERN